MNECLEAKSDVSRDKVRDNAAEEGSRGASPLRLAGSRMAGAAVRG